MAFYEIPLPAQIKNPYRERVCYLSFISVTSQCLMPSDSSVSRWHQIPQPICRGLTSSHTGGSEGHCTMSFYH